VRSSSQSPETAGEALASVERRIAVTTAAASELFFEGILDLLFGLFEVARHLIGSTRCLELGITDALARGLLNLPHCDL